MARDTEASALLLYLSFLSAAMQSSKAAGHVAGPQQGIQLGLSSGSLLGTLPTLGVHLHPEVVQCLGHGSPPWLHIHHHLGSFDECQHLDPIPEPLKQNLQG